MQYVVMAVSANRRPSRIHTPYNNYDGSMSISMAFAYYFMQFHRKADDPPKLFEGTSKKGKGAGKMKSDV